MTNTAADDHILQPADDAVKAVPVPLRQVAGVEPAVPQGGCRLFRHFIVAPLLIEAAKAAKQEPLPWKKAPQSAETLCGAFFHSGAFHFCIKSVHSLS